MMTLFTLASYPDSFRVRAVVHIDPSITICYALIIIITVHIIHNNCYRVAIYPFPVTSLCKLFEQISSYIVQKGFDKMRVKNRQHFENGMCIQPETNPYVFSSVDKYSDRKVNSREIRHND